MRIKSIDVLRGLTICTMFAANFVKLFSSDPPPLLDHALPQVILPFDLVAPLFGFIMGLCLPFSIEHGRAHPARILRRAMALFLLGYIPNFVYRMGVTAAGTLETALTTWGILETWAVAYMLVYLISRLPAGSHAPIFVTLLTAYSVVMSTHPELTEVVIARKEGGALAAPAWTFIGGIGFLAGKSLIRDNAGAFRLKSAGIAFGLSAFGLGLHWWALPMDRLAVSASYVLFSSGICVVLFLAFHVLNINLGRTVRLIGRWPLLAWLTQGIIYIPVNYTLGLQYFNWPAGGAAAGISLILVILVTRGLVRAGITFRV